MNVHRWWKNGDHPEDGSLLTEGGGLTEGLVVGAYRGPEHPRLLCPDCGQAYEVHGSLPLLGSAVIVHPGDFIVTHAPGVYAVVRPDPRTGAFPV